MGTPIVSTTLQMVYYYDSSDNIALRLTLDVYYFMFASVLPFVPRFDPFGSEVLPFVPQFDPFGLVVLPFVPRFNPFGSVVWPFDP